MYKYKNTTNLQHRRTNLFNYDTASLTKTEIENE